MKSNKDRAHEVVEEWTAWRDEFADDPTEVDVHSESELKHKIEQGMYEAAAGCLTLSPAEIATCLDALVASPGCVELELIQRMRVALGRS